MGNMILVDFDTIIDQNKRLLIKDFVIEHMVKHPDTIITVLNSNFQAKTKKTKKLLRQYKFPVDGVACNPLNIRTPPLTFKTMFASTLTERAEHTVILVIDQESAALEMWRKHGVKYTLSPELKESKHK